jgi:uncharacterized protein (DUF3820 family)
MPIDDEDVMPWGVHAGKKMQDVPAKYLIWLLETNKCAGDVKKYIQDNLEHLKLEVKQGING